jgi:hypothetical protein
MTKIAEYNIEPHEFSAVVEVLKLAEENKRLRKLLSAVQAQSASVEWKPVEGGKFDACMVYYDKCPKCGYTPEIRTGGKS